MSELLLYSYMWSHNSAHLRKTMGLRGTNKLQKIGKWEKEQGLGLPLSREILLITGQRPQYLLVH